MNANMDLVPSLISKPVVRQIFKSYSKKDSKIFRNAENLNDISNGHSWIIYYTKNFKIDVLKMTDIKNVEDKFSKYFPSYSISFSILKSLKFSLPSLVVQVTHKGKIVYHSIFVSVSNYSSASKVSLLLLVLKSSKKTTVATIHKALQKLLGCHISRAIPTEAQIYWLFGICLHETLRRDRSASDLTIKCKLPVPIDTEFELSLYNDSLKAIWDSITDSCEDILNIHVVTTLKNELFQHFSQTYGINLKTAPIISFNLKDVAISFKDQVTLLVKKPEITLCVLSYLEAEFC